MNSKFVTCIYNGLNGGKLCGRLNRDQTYNYSLGAISRTEENIVCYTSPTEMEGLQSYFSNHEPSHKITFKPWDLYSLYFHNKVNNLRDANSPVYRESPDWRDRCVEIMWGKFVFIRDAISSDPSLDYIFWIDAGISHAGIIHSRFNPHYEHNINFIRDLDKSTYPYTFKNELIFNPEFMNKLIKYTGDNHILNIVTINPQHPRLDTTNAFRGSVIGGIFGGRREFVVDYCNKVIDMFEKYLNEGILCKEEQIMTEILAEGSFPIKTFMFQTWYHPDWGDRYLPSQTSFCDFFDEISK